MKVAFRPKRFKCYFHVLWTETE